MESMPASSIGDELRLHCRYMTKAGILLLIAAAVAILTPSSAAWPTRGVQHTSDHKENCLPKKKLLSPARSDGTCDGLFVAIASFGRKHDHFLRDKAL